MLKSLVVKLETMESGTDACSKARFECGKMFLKNVRGVVFYAVPHAGSDKFAEYVSKLLSRNEGDLRRIMDNVKPWQPDMGELSMSFDDIVKENKINIFAFCEGRAMEEVVRMCWRKWIFATKHL